MNVQQARKCDLYLFLLTVFNWGKFDIFDHLRTLARVSSFVEKCKVKFVWYQYQNTSKERPCRDSSETGSDTFFIFGINKRRSGWLAGALVATMR